MRNGHLELVAALALLATTGCNNDYGEQTPGNGAGGQTTAGQATGGQTTGGQSATSTGQSNGGQSTSGQSTTGQGTSTSTGTAGDAPECTATNVAPCGGDVVGTWNVTSSCLELSGDLDVFLTSLACPTVPATGFLQTTGTLVANADGTYEDNTVTTGSVTFPLDSSCLAISGIQVECDRAGDIFQSLGWTTTACSAADGQCSCALSTEQQGGIGAVLPFTEQTGSYSVSGNTLTLDPATYSYCASGDTLTLTPEVKNLEVPLAGCFSEKGPPRSTVSAARQAEAAQAARHQPAALDP